MLLKGKYYKLMRSKSYEDVMFEYNITGKGHLIDCAAKFLQHLHADYEYAAKMYHTNGEWHYYISHLVAYKLNYEFVYMPYMKESEEFFDFIDGNGYKVTNIIDDANIPCKRVTVE